MFIYKNRYSILFKTITAILVCLFSVNDLSWAAPSYNPSAQTTLAAQLRTKPFFDKWGIDFRGGWAASCAAVELRNLFVKGDLFLGNEVRGGQIARLNNKDYLKGNIEISTNIEKGSLSSGKKWALATFNFKKEGKQIQVLLLGDYKDLTKDDRKELTRFKIKNDRDIEHLSFPGLKGVWFVNPDFGLKPSPLTPNTNPEKRKLPALKPKYLEDLQECATSILATNNKVLGVIKPLHARLIGKGDESLALIISTIERCNAEMELMHRTVELLQKNAYESIASDERYAEMANDIAWGTMVERLQTTMRNAIFLIEKHSDFLPGKASLSKRLNSLWVTIMEINDRRTDEVADTEQRHQTAAEREIVKAAKHSIEELIHNATAEVKKAKERGVWIPSEEPDINRLAISVDNFQDAIALVRGLMAKQSYDAFLLAHELIRAIEHNCLMFEGRVENVNPMDELIRNILLEIDTLEDRELLTGEWIDVVSELRAMLKGGEKKEGGAPATLLKYLFGYRDNEPNQAPPIDSNNPKLPRDMAKQRGGNDSLSNIYRELAPLEGSGLVEGGKGKPRYLTELALRLGVEEIIRQNPELNLPNPSEEQINAVVERIKRIKPDDGSQPNPGPVSTAFPNPPSDKPTAADMAGSRKGEKRERRDEGRKKTVETIDVDLKIPQGASTRWISLWLPGMENASFFFRHRENKGDEAAFNSFIDKLAENAKNSEGVRILSAGCARGEEAYTIALSLLERDVPPDKIEVIGIDSDEVVINSAKYGVYSKIALTFVLETPLLHKYFSKAGHDTYRIKKNIRRLVRFKACDISNADEMTKLGIFDGVVFKNVAYQIPWHEFSFASKRSDAYRNIAMVTKEDGLLFTTEQDGHRIFVKRQGSRNGFKAYAGELVKPKGSASSPQNGDGSKSATPPESPQDPGQTPWGGQGIGNLTRYIRDGWPAEKVAELAQQDIKEGLMTADELIAALNLMVAQKGVPSDVANACRKVAEIIRTKIETSAASGGAAAKGSAPAAAVEGVRVAAPSRITKGVSISNLIAHYKELDGYDYYKLDWDPIPTIAQLNELKTGCGEHLDFVGLECAVYRGGDGIWCFRIGSQESMKPSHSVPEENDMFKQYRTDSIDIDTSCPSINIHFHYGDEKRSSPEDENSARQHKIIMMDDYKLNSVSINKVIAFYIYTTKYGFTRYDETGIYANDIPLEEFPETLSRFCEEASSTLSAAGTAPAPQTEGTGPISKTKTSQSHPIDKELAAYAQALFNDENECMAYKPVGDDPEMMILESMDLLLNRYVEPIIKKPGVKVSLHELASMPRQFSDIRRQTLFKNAFWRILRDHPHSAMVRKSAIIAITTGDLRQDEKIALLEVLTKFKEDPIVLRFLKDITQGTVADEELRGSKSAMIIAQRALEAVEAPGVPPTHEEDWHRFVEHPDNSTVPRGAAPAAAAQGLLYARLGADEKRNIDGVNKNNDPEIADVLAAFLLREKSQDETVTTLGEHLFKTYLGRYNDMTAAAIAAREMVRQLTQPMAMVKEPEKSVPHLSLDAITAFFNQHYVGEGGDFDHDIRLSEKLVKEIIQHDINTIMVIGDSLTALPIYLALLGKDVVFVDMSDKAIASMQEKFNDVITKLKEQGYDSECSFRVIQSEIGALDLEASGLKAGSFDLVTLIDLAYNPQGDPVKWFTKTKELLKPQGYVVTDETDWSIWESQAAILQEPVTPHTIVLDAFSRIFPNATCIMDNIIGGYSRAWEGKNALNNVLYKVNAETSDQTIKKGNEPQIAIMATAAESEKIGLTEGSFMVVKFAPDRKTLLKTIKATIAGYPITDKERKKMIDNTLYAIKRLRKAGFPVPRTWRVDDYTIGQEFIDGMPHSSFTFQLQNKLSSKIDRIVDKARKQFKNDFDRKRIEIDGDINDFLYNRKGQPISWVDPVIPDIDLLNKAVLLGKSQSELKPGFTHTESVASPQEPRAGQASVAEDISSQSDIDELCKLAENQKTYYNPDSRKLYEIAAKHLGITGGLALDVGTGTNYLPAQGLVDAGLDKVITITESHITTYKEGRPVKEDDSEKVVSEKIVKKTCDARALPFDDDTFVTVIYNQSISFIKIGSSLRDVRRTLKESFRVLKPGSGWIMIKPGSYLAASHLRREEGSKIVSLLTQIGFENITVLSAKGTDIPVFIYARKPLQYQAIPAAPTPRRESVLATSFLAASAEADRIHTENLKYTPRASNTVLCHITAPSTLPDGQQGILNRLESSMRGREYCEKMLELKTETPGHHTIADFIEQVRYTIQEAQKTYKDVYGKDYNPDNFKFDVACPSLDLVARVQKELKLPALAFAPQEGEGNMVQPENIMLALRALEQAIDEKDIKPLVDAYAFVTGKEITSSIKDIAEFAKTMLFAMPRINVNELGRINALIEENIKTAA